MTPDQLAKIEKLNNCSFLPGSYPKRFVKDLAYVAKHNPEKELSQKQVNYLEVLYHKYRRQIPGHEANCLLCKTGITAEEVLKR